MAKRPGHVDVVIEVGYCSFCQRTRNLRREEHHLGGLVRTILSCETCHRTLSSTMGVAAAQHEAAEEVAAPAEPKPEPVLQEPTPRAASITKPAAGGQAPAKSAPARSKASKPAAAKTAAARPAASKSAESKSRAKPPATRRTTRGK